VPSEKYPSWIVKAAAALRSVNPLARDVRITLSSPQVPGLVVRLEDREEAEGELDGTALKILDVLTKATRPLKAAAIARLATLEYNSYFRGAMSRLKTAGRIYRPDPTMAAYAIVTEKR
jgi:hypothetical protein